MNKAYRLVWSAARNLWIVAAELVSGKGGPPPVSVRRTSSKPDSAVRSLPLSSFIMALEPRFMFDAAGAATAAVVDASSETLTPAQNVDQANQYFDLNSESSDRADNGNPYGSSDVLDALAYYRVQGDLTGQDQDQPVSGVLFVDPRVPDIQTLIAGVKPGIEVVFLDAQKDGVAQISSYLQSHTDISSIYIFSHGSTGSVAIGTTSLDASTISGRSSEITAWSASLTNDADILLYGCDVAAGANGLAFIGQLAVVTGADVAASTDATGSAWLGGNWVLERNTGAIEAKSLLTAAAMAGYEGLLAAPAGVNDTATAVEAGGVANGTAGSNGTGNVLTNDTDVGAGTVTDARTGTEAAGGGLSAVSAGSTSANGLALAGTYGTLSIGADGTYSYAIDNNNALVQALRVTGQTVSDSFTYRVTNGDGSDLAELTVTVDGRNDTPVTVADSATAIEAGGLTNATAGTNATGNVLTNDTDIDSVANGETKTVTTTGATAGTYGTLTLNADGSFTYVVDESNATVQALRITGQTVSEAFNYTMSDTGGLTSSSTLTVTIDGRADNPVGVDDTATAVEAGGLANGTAGSNGTGNVLTNDTDVDSAGNGETKSVTNARLGTEVIGGGFASVSAGTTSGDGTALIGTYGTLTIGSDGTYSYAIDNSNALVQALRVTGQVVSESFTYRITDTSGLTDIAQLTITIDGRNDTPVAVADSATAIEAGGLANATAGTNATGNVLTNDTDVDVTGETKTVTTTGATIGTYGTLTLNADGSFTYVVDESNVLVQALRVTGQTVTEAFNYTMSDTGGLTSSSTLTITIDGRNDTPVAVADSATAIEAGGLANATAGTNATGNVLTNDTDVDVTGETKTVTVGTGATVGTYGTLTLNANGSYTYVVNESNVAVQALRITGQTLSEAFNYTMSDLVGLTSSSTLTITIDGRNDTPVAVADSATAIEAGGLANATAGTNATGNVLTNDTDVDVTGETKTVTVGTGATVGTYGTLTLNDNGSFTYVVDESNVLVQALRVTGQTLSEAFNYTMSDLVGLTSSSTLTITIDGRNDTPVAVADSATAIEAGGLANATAGTNATGNVLTNDTDVDVTGETKTVTTTGATVGTYGTLTLNANGSYTYVVNESNAAVQALNAGDTVAESFNYTMTDTGGLTSSSTLTVTINGTNDNPVNTLPASLVSPLQASVLFGGLNVSDVDSPVVTVTLSVAHGVLQLVDPGSINLTISGNGSSVVTLAGSLVEINALIGGSTAITYVPDQTFSGNDPFTISTNDGNVTVTNSTNINVTQQNAPLEPPSVPPVAPPFVPPVSIYVPPSNETLGGIDTSFYQSFNDSQQWYDLLDLLEDEELFGKMSGAMKGLVVIGGDDASTGREGLHITKTTFSQEGLVGEAFSFRLPQGLFRHSDPDARVRVEAALADGRPLRGWLEFDSKNGRFTGKPPVGSAGYMAIKVTARDQNGNFAEARILIHITESKSVRPAEGDFNSSLLETDNSDGTKRDVTLMPSAAPGSSSRNSLISTSENMKGRASLTEQMSAFNQRGSAPVLLSAMRTSVAAISKTI